MNENGKNGKSESIKLRVGELTGRDDFGRGIVRIDNKNMKKMGVREGDIVEVKGKKSTGALVVRAYPADIGLDIIRMDGILRKNCSTSIGESVFIKKTDYEDAKSVTLAPVGVQIREDMLEYATNLLKQNLTMRPLVIGDIIMANPVIRVRKKSDDFMDMENDPMIDMLKSFGFDVGSFGMNAPTLGDVRFNVVSISPKGIVRVTEDTKIELMPNESSKSSIPQITYEDIGGMDEEKNKVREMIEMPIRHPELFEKLGIEPPRGVLLYGPPGTGKTLLAKAVANESGANFIEVKNEDIISPLPGQTEKKIRNLFDEAEKNAPSIIFIDELDSIAFKREARGTNEFMNTPVMELLKNLDGLKDRGNVIVIGATNRVDALDPALRRGGRFDREIEIGVPDKKGRKEILQIHTRSMPLENVDIEKLANGTYGFVGADITSLCKEAAMRALRRVLQDIGEIKESEPLSEEVLKKLTVKAEDFEYALTMVQPSAMREVMIEKPDVKWQDIGGLDDVKKELNEAVEWPLKNPESFVRLGITPPRGILLYGPPGCGKTMIAKAVANECDANFILINGPEILESLMGGSEKRLREIFQKARQVAPCIIFIDEIDAFTPQRGLRMSGNYESIVAQLLSLMSGLEDMKNVFVLAATNRPDMIDPALMRPGRFDKQILISSPDKESRKRILEIQINNMPIEKGVDIETLAKRTEGFSGADLGALCREAAMNALRKDIKSQIVTIKDFEKALMEIIPSINENINTAYKKIMNAKKKVKPEEPKDELDYRQ